MTDERQMQGRRNEPPEWVTDTYGFDPRDIGRRYRDWEVRDEQNMDDYYLDLDDEFLVVCARDGAANEPDFSVGQYNNFVGSVEGVDPTYRYYYFNPTESETDP